MSFINTVPRFARNLYTMESSLFGTESDPPLSLNIHLIYFYVKSLGGFGFVNIVTYRDL